MGFCQNIWKVLVLYAVVSNTCWGISFPTTLSYPGKYLPTSSHLGKCTCCHVSAWPPPSRPLLSDTWPILFWWVHCQWLLKIWHPEDFSVTEIITHTGGGDVSSHVERRSALEEIKQTSRKRQRERWREFWPYLGRLQYCFSHRLVAHAFLTLSVK